MIMYGTIKPKLVKDIEMLVELPIENPQIGKSSSFGVKLNNSNDSCHTEFVLFELINERTDKRAPLDKVTSRSRYLYRYNIEEGLEKGEKSYSFDIRIPFHKESSRNDKFIRIRWQLNSQVYFRKSKEDKDLCCSESTPVEVEVV